MCDGYARPSSTSPTSSPSATATPSHRNRVVYDDVGTDNYVPESPIEIPTRGPSDD
ncbi:hypothetical protein P3S67_020613 [Capsicum chacoense]